MIDIITLSTVLLVVAAGPVGDGAKKGDGPKQSADVVEAKLMPYSLADGLESYLVELKVAKGWHLYANTEDFGNSPKLAKPPAHAVTVVEFLTDGKKASTCGIYYPRGVAKKDAAGGEYRAYQGTVSLTAWLIWDETQNAKVVSVRVKVIATNGETRLKESIVTAEVR